MHSAARYLPLNRREQIKAARGPKVCWHSAEIIARSISMMDVVMVALAFGFCAVSIAYVYACERL